MRRKRPHGFTFTEYSTFDTLASVVMGTDSRDPRIEKDGVRVFDDGRGRRTARARILVVVAIGAAALVVAITARAVLFLRRGSGPSTDARDVSSRAGGERRGAGQHVPQQP